MNAPHGSLGKGYSAAGNMVSPGNFAPVSVVGTGNLAHVSQTPVEQPEETVPQYSETPTPFYLNQVRNRSPGKSPAEWLAGAAMNSSTFQSWPGPDHSTSPVAPGSASHSGIRESDLVAGDGSHLVGLSPLQSIAHVSNNQATNHRGSPAAANISPPDQATAAAMQMQSRSPGPAMAPPSMAAPSSTDHEAAAAAGHSPADTSARSETTEVSLMGDISPDVSSTPLPPRYHCHGSESSRWLLLCAGAELCRRPPLTPESGMASDSREDFWCAPTTSPKTTLLGSRRSFKSHGTGVFVCAGGAPAEFEESESSYTGAY